MDEAEQAGESSALGQSQAKAGMAASPTHQQGSQTMDTGRVEERVGFAEATNSDHAEASADSDARRTARTSSSHHISSHVEQLGKSDSSAFPIKGGMPQARTHKGECTGDTTTTPVVNSSSSPPCHASTEGCGSIGHLYSPPHHIRTGTEVAQLANDATSPKQLTPVKPALMNGFGQDRRLKFQSSPSSEISTLGRNRASRLRLDANHSEDDDTTASPEKSQERLPSTSHLGTVTGRLPKPKEPVVLSKMEIQASRQALKRLTCYHWKQKGGCRYRDDECQYAHYDTGLDEGKNTTCFWWWNFGHCKKSERECQYTHRDTGLYAKPPPGYIPQKRKPCPWEFG
jgi:hypothetical protein